MSDLDPFEITNWDCCDKHETAFMIDSYCKDCRIEELETKYQELIMEVVCKFPNETRHETAKRYIHEREKLVVDAQAMAAIKGDDDE